MCREDAVQRTRSACSSASSRRCAPGSRRKLAAIGTWAKEMGALFELGAYRIMGLKESRDFRRAHPEHVLRTRYVDRWKPTDDGGVIAKSRIVI